MRGVLLLTAEMFHPNYKKHIISRYDKVRKAIEEDKKLTEFEKEIKHLMNEIDRWSFTIDQNICYLKLDQEIKKHKGRFYESLLINAARFYNEQTFDNCIAPLTAFLYILRDDVFVELATRLDMEPAKTSHVRIAGFIFLPKHVREHPSFKEGSYFENFIDVPADLIFDNLEEVTPDEKTMLTESASE
jgi:hypothetical protein